MLKYKDPMFDDVFLKQLSSEHEREIYAKIVALDLNENPIEEIHKLKDPFFLLRK